MFYLFLNFQLRTRFFLDIVDLEMYFREIIGSLLCKDIAQFRSKLVNQVFYRDF
jgi:hypothetical protein